MALGLVGAGSRGHPSLAQPHLHFQACPGLAGAPPGECCSCCVIPGVGGSWDRSVAAHSLRGAAFLGALFLYHLPPRDKETSVT